MFERRSKNRKWPFRYYKSSTGEVPAKEFIEAQEKDLQYLILLRLQQLMMENVDLDSQVTTPVEGSDVLELRAAERNGTVYSILYFEHESQTYVGVHGFCRGRTERVPEGAVNTAIQRMNEHRRNE